MTTKADFSAEEWAEIKRAPFMAGLAVVAASPSGPFGVVKEMFAVGRALADVKNKGAAASDLVTALVADLEAGGASAQSAPAELQGKSPDQIKRYSIEALQHVAAVVGRKAKPDEVQAFKQWLVSVSQRVAEAAREGGFLGFGGTQVSEQEASVIKELSASLGTTTV
jgi:hypothetical protein